MYIAIARIVDGANKTLGWRLIDLNAFDKNNVGKGGNVAVADKTLEECKMAMSRQPKCVVNLELKADGTIAGTNGAVDRYATINMATGEVSKAPLVVLYRVGKDGFICANFTGAVKTLSNKSAVTYAKSAGIANGKVINKGGKEFIGAIKGEYEMVPSNLESLKSSAKKTNYLLMSDGEPLADLYTKIQNAKSAQGQSVVGKLNYETTDKLITYAVKERKLLDHMKANQISDIQRVIKEVLTDIKIIRKVGDVEAIKFHCTGLSGVMSKAGEKEKKLYNNLASGKGRQSKVNFSS